MGNQNSNKSKSSSGSSASLSHRSSSLARPFQVNDALRNRRIECRICHLSIISNEYPDHMYAHELQRQEEENRNEAVADEAEYRGHEGGERRGDENWNSSRSIRILPSGDAIVTETRLTPGGNSSSSSSVRVCYTNSPSASTGESGFWSGERSGNGDYSGRGSGGLDQRPHIHVGPQLYQNDPHYVNLGFLLPMILGELIPPPGFAPISASSSPSSSTSSSHTGGLSKAEFDLFSPFPFHPTTTATSTSASASTSAENRCPVCQEEFVAEEEIVLTPCFHKYHTECLWTWAKDHCQCPVCKRNLRNPS